MPPRAVVTRAYRRPYRDPIRVRAGETVVPDFARTTHLPGWVWCTDPRGRGGWTPRAWLERENAHWRITRAFDAVELTVEPGQRIALHFAHAGFHWVTTDHIAPEAS